MVIVVKPLVLWWCSWWGMLPTSKLPRCHASCLSSHRVVGILFANSSSLFATGDGVFTGDCTDGLALVEISPHQT